MALFSSALKLSLSTLTLWFGFYLSWFFGDVSKNTRRAHVRACIRDCLRASVIVNDYRPLYINLEIVSRNERVARWRRVVIKCWRHREIFYRPQKSACSCVSQWPPDADLTWVVVKQLHNVEKSHVWSKAMITFDQIYFQLNWSLIIITWLSI